MQNLRNGLSAFFCQIIGMYDPRRLDRIKFKGSYLLHIDDQPVEIVKPKKAIRKKIQRGGYFKKPLLQRIVRIKL